MHYDEIAHLQCHHSAWNLLRSPHAPLVLSFLARVFIEPNAGSRPAAALISELDDELYALNARLGDDAFPRTAQAYLDEWASPEKGWLRKYYPAGTDEAHYDVTPPVEKAVLWIKDLQTRDLVSTESRLNTLFDLLRQMVFGADTDPASQLAQLRRQRAELDAKIARAERGEVTLLDSKSQRDRYYHSREMPVSCSRTSERSRRTSRP